VLNLGEYGEPSTESSFPFDRNEDVHCRGVADRSNSRGIDVDLRRFTALQALGVGGHERRALHDRIHRDFSSEPLDDSLPSDFRRKVQGVPGERGSDTKEIVLRAC